MKRILIASTCLFAFVSHANAVVPVIDSANLVQWGTSIKNEIAAYTLQAKQYIGEQFSWATQAQQYAMQGQQYVTEATQLASFVHAPNMGAAMGMLNMAGLGNALPVNPYAAMGLVSGLHYGGGGLPQIQGVFGSLSAFSQSAYTQNHVYTPTDGTWDSQQTITRANSIAGAQGAAQASVNDYQAHQAAFQALRTRLTTATTPKDVQDIQAQIALEQAWFANEQGQMQSISLAYQAQRDSDVQQDNERLKQSFQNFITSN